MCGLRTKDFEDTSHQGKLKSATASTKEIYQKAKEAGLEMVMLLLTDILNEGSEILVTGAKPEIVEKAFNITLKDKGAFLPGVLSRKKQVVPPITNAITS